MQESQEVRMKEKSLKEKEGYHLMCVSSQHTDMKLQTSDLLLIVPPLS